MYEECTGEWIEYMKNDGWIALFWDGYCAGIGWILFESEEDLLEWANWLLSDEALGGRDNWPKEGLEKLSVILKNKEIPIVDRVVKFLELYHKMTSTFVFGATYKVFTYEGLINDLDIQEDFQELLKKKDIAPCSLEERLDLVEDGRLFGLVDLFIEAG